MISKNQLRQKRGLAILAVAVVLTAFGAMTGLLWPPLLTKADATLPPRDEPTPHPDDDHDHDRTPVGAHILLQAGSVPAEAWGVVQWLGNDDNWHDVEGWQGPVPANSQ